MNTYKQKEIKMETSLNNYKNGEVNKIKSAFDSFNNVMLEYSNFIKPNYLKEPERSNMIQHIRDIYELRVKTGMANYCLFIMNRVNELLLEAGMPDNIYHSIQNEFSIYIRENMSNICWSHCYYITELQYPLSNNDINYHGEYIVSVNAPAMLTTIYANIHNILSSQFTRFNYISNFQIIEPMINSIFDEDAIIILTHELINQFVEYCKIISLVPPSNLK